MTDPPLCVDSGLLVTRVKAALSPHLTPSRVWGEALCGGVACSQNTRANLRRARGWCCVLAYGPRCRRGARPRLEVSQFIPIEATPALPHPAGQRPSDTGPAEWGPLCHADTRRQPPSPSWTCPHTRKHCLSLPGRPDSRPRPPDEAGTATEFIRREARLWGPVNQPPRPQARGRSRRGRCNPDRAPLPHRCPRAPGGTAAPPHPRWLKWGWHGLLLFSSTRL